MSTPAVLHRATFQSPYAITKAPRHVKATRPRLGDHLLCVVEFGDPKFLQETCSGEFSVIDLATRQKAWFYVKDRNGKYGGQVSRVLGIVGRTGGNEYALRTRMHNWTIQRAGTAMANAADLEQKDWMQTNKRVREFEQAAGIPIRSDVRFPMDFSLGQGEALSPWTSVSNCTGTTADEKAQDALDQERRGKLTVTAASERRFERESEP